MSTITFSFTGKCVLELEHTTGTATTQHVQTKFNLDVSPNLDKSKYLDSEDLPTREGAKALTNVFVQGLIGNIHHAHQHGYWDSAKHMKYILDEIEKGFIQVMYTRKSEF